MKNYLLSFIRVLLVIFFTYLFFAVFWFHLIDPITVWTNFFSGEALHYAFREGLLTTQLMSPNAVLALIPGLESAMSSTAIPFGPIWMQALIFGYLIPISLSLLFSLLTIGNITIVIRAFKMKRKIKHLQKQLRLIDMDQKAMNNRPVDIELNHTNK